MIRLIKEVDENDFDSQHKIKHVNVKSNIVTSNLTKLTGESHLEKYSIIVMPSTCVVPGCSGLGGFSFPKDPELSVKWRIAIKRQVEDSGPGPVNLWKPSKSSRICHAHFKEEDFKATLSSAYSSNPRKARFLKEGIIPSIFPWSPPVQSQDEASSQSSNSQSSSPMPSTSSAPQSAPDDFIAPLNLDIGGEVEVHAMVEIVQGASDDNVSPAGTPNATPAAPIDIAIQVQVDSAECGAQTRQTGGFRQAFSIKDIKDDPEAVKFYTSFVSYKHFRHVLHCLGPAAYHLDYKSRSLDTEDEFFLFMMKIRLNNEDQDLAYRFNISATVVSSIFLTWLQFLYFQLQGLVKFISKDVIDQHMPKDFKTKYPATRVILDATEIEIGNKIVRFLYYCVHQMHRRHPKRHILTFARQQHEPCNGVLY